MTLPENFQNPDNISLKIQIQVMVSAEGAFFIVLDRAQQLNPTSPKAVGYTTVTLKKTSMVYTYWNDTGSYHRNRRIFWQEND